MNKEILDIKCIIRLNQCKPILDRLALDSDWMNEELFEIKCSIRLNQCKPILERLALNPV